MLNALRLPRYIVLFVLGLLTGCSSLGAFNAVIPKDSGSKLAASGIAFGPEPRQKLDVYVPTPAPQDAPVLVFVYGGSWDNGSRSDYGFVGRAFASRGYVTILFDYRLVPDVRYPAFVEDTAKAVAWAYRNAKTYGGNPKRLFLAGHSAGAYNAMMVALAPEFLAAEGLSPAILTGVAGLSGPYDFLPLDGPVTRAAFGGAADLPSTQPVNRVRRDAAVPPILLLHGEADTLVYPRNSVALASALRRAGKSVTHKTYPGIDHPGTLLAISRPLRGRAPVLQDVVDFFAAR